MATSYTYILGVDFTAIDIDLSAFQAIIAASSISSAVVQYLTRSGTSVAIWFNGALSGGDQTTLTGLVSAYVYSAPTVLVYVDTTTVQTITNKKLDTTNTVIDSSVASKSLGFSLSGMSTSTQLTLAGALTSSRTYTFPEAGAASDVILSNSTGTQTISTGNLTLAGTVAILALSGATSALTLANTTASTSSTTGALRVVGGAYFGANSLLNANLTMAGTSAILALSGASAIATFANTTASTSSTTGALQVAGGAYFGANSLLNANLTMAGTSAILALSGASAIATFANTTISTSSTTGTIRNLGGLFTKNIWLGGVAFVTQAVSTAGPLLNIAATTITANNTSDMAFVSVQQPTLANSTISSVTANASTVYIADAPAAGTNQTITNPFSLNVAAGKVRFGGAFQLTTGAANGYLLSSDASGNASWISPLPFGYTGFADGTVSAPGAYWASETSTGFYRIGAGNIALTLSGSQYINYTTTFSSFLNTLQISKAGNATSTLASLYSNPASTLFSGSNNYFFNYFNTPTSTGSTTGTASTVFIAGAPSNATTSFALNVAAGASLFGGNVTMSGASAILALAGASSIATLANTAISISSTTGALQVAGGAYFGANSLFNANLTMQGTSAILALTGASSIATFANTAISTSSTTGALQVAGGAYFGANSLFNANLTMQGASAILALTGASSIATLANTAISTSSTTGALRNLGGLFTKNIWLGGVAFVTQAVSTAGPLLNIASTTITANNTSDMAFVSVQQPTLANSTISSVTANAATVYIADAPVAGINQTITNPLALNVAAGKVKFGGAFQLTTGAVNNYLLTSDASGNATWSAPEGVVSLADYNAISTTSFSTNSITATNITAMTLTPTVAGTYWITYTSNFRGTASNTTSTFDLAFNGTAITNTTNIFPQTTQTNTYTVVINVFQVFNGTTDTIMARTRVNATSTSVTVIYRSMLALRVSA